MPALIPNDGKNTFLYQYEPNLGAAYTSLVFIGSVTIVHFFMMLKYRSWFYTPLIIGGTAEAFGYYGRSWSARQPKNVNPFVMQVLLLMGAPPFIAATMYMTLTRVVSAVRGEQSLKWVTGIYVLIDVIAWLSQIVGSGLQATNDNHIIEIGTKIVLGGLIFQLVALAAFLVIAFKMKWKLRSENAGHVRRAVAWYFRGLYVATIALWVRSLVRAIEFAQPVDGPIISNEWFIYVFDALPMLMILVLLLLPHAGWLVSNEASKERLPVAKEDRHGLEIGLIGTGDRVD